MVSRPRVRLDSPFIVVAKNNISSPLLRFPLELKSNLNNPIISCSMDTRRSDDQQIIGSQVFWGSCTPAGNGFSSLFPYIDERPSGDAVTASYGRCSGATSASEGRVTKRDVMIIILWIN